MRPRAGRVEDLTAVLSQLVGVRVTQYGGLGSFATVSIRGSSSSQVRTFLDGMPIDDPYLGVTNLSDLPLGGVERIEVYRGFSPPQLGGSAIGGAVSLITRDDASSGGGFFNAAEAALSAGSFDTRRENGSLFLRPGPVRVFAHGTYERSQGDFEFEDDNGTPYNLDDDEVATRVNNDFEGWNGIARVSTDIPRVAEASLAYYDASRENGVPGLGSYQSTTARSERRRQMGQARLEGVPLFANKQLRWWANGFYQRANEQFYDPDSDVSLLAQDTDNTIDSYGGGARARWMVPRVPIALEATYLGQKEQYHPVNHLPQPTSGPDRWRHATTWSLCADVYLLEQTLVLTATQRWEENTDEFFDPPRFPWLPPTPQGVTTHRTDTPSFGVRYQPWRWLGIKANAGRYYRLPTFLELFGNTGSVTGNALLEPEQGENRDVGVVLNFANLGAVRSLLLEVSRFDNKAENLILFFPNSQYTVKPTNIGASRIRGWEVSAAAMWTDWEFAAGYTLLDAEDTSDIPYYHGNELPSRPQDDVSASLSYAWRSLRATYEFHYMSANWLDRANLSETPSRELHNLLVRVRTPVDGLALILEGQNLADERPVDVAGYPLPGRSLYTTLSYDYR
ncbi:MAG TPA: TonB-dependent receptor [Candidatus Krumholzibacteria bacterium]|nr:TonB-dependent receptor [Candidatus Krumholzibacteria bacterium]